MGIADVILISLGLAMDASAVGMADGIASKPDFKKTLVIALSFGFFQGLFPLVSYFAGSLLAGPIKKIAPWLALALLSVIGVHMIIEGCGKKAEDVRPLSLNALLIQSVSVSLDAFAVGLTFVNQKFNIFLAVAIIAAVTAVLTFAAVLIGKRFQKMFSNKARVAGGIILVAIGVKIFIESLF